MKTTLYTVLCVAVRLGAVLMAVNVLERVPDVFIYPGRDGTYSIGALLLEGTSLLVALALWLWPNILVWWAIGRNRHEILESPIVSDDIQRIAFSVLGVWLCISGIGGLLGHGTLILIVQRRAVYEGVGEVPTSEWHWLVQYAITAVAGAGLALGSRGLVGGLRRLRGYPAAEAPATHDAGITQDD
jgi:hypothetical protein